MGARQWAWLAVVIALAACKKKSDGVSPYELLEMCTPGKPTWRCDHALHTLPPQMFPADRLEGIELSSPLVPHVPHGMVAGRPADKALLVYVLYFNVGRDFVMELLEKELGQPLGQGRPRVPAILVHVGDYWQTEEGYWICFDRGVAFYTHPYQSKDGRTILGLIIRPPDSPFDRPLPRAAALWTKIGRMLIGNDRKLRPRIPPWRPSRD